MKRLFFRSVVMMIMALTYTDSFAYSTLMCSGSNDYCLINHVANSQQGTIVGIWEDDYTQGMLWRIRKDPNLGYVLDIGDIRDTSKWIRSTTLKEEYLNGYRVFFDKGNIEQYYIVEKNGNLSVFDNYGWIATYRKIKL